MSGIRTLEDMRQRCHVDDETGCWLWRMAVANTTPSMRLPALGRTVAAGVAICFLTTDALPAPGVIWHRIDTCRSMLCVCPAHRTAGTQLSKMAFMRGTKKPPLTKVRMAAARRAHSVVTEAIVADIRSSKLTGTELAGKHGISVSHACRIKRNTARRPLGVSAFSTW